MKKSCNVSPVDYILFNDITTKISVIGFFIYCNRKIITAASWIVLFVCDSYLFIVQIIAMVYVVFMCKLYLPPLNYSSNNCCIYLMTIINYSTTGLIATWD